MSLLSGYLTLSRWQLLQAASYLPVVVVLQLVIGAGTVVGMGFLIPQLDRESATYLATGAPTLGLIMLGIAAVPQSVSQARLGGLYDYFQAQPVGRLSYLVAEMTVLLLIAVPGSAAALFVAVVRFDVVLRPAPAALLVGLLVALTATAVGYVIALAVRAPAAVSLVSSATLFGVLFFSPISFPADRLPGWLQGVHTALPFGAMADAMRASLTGTGGIVSPLLIVSAWAIAAGGFALAVGSRSR